MSSVAPNGGEVHHAALCLAAGPRRDRRAARRGFTLIELMVVLVVMSILAASIVPSFVSSARAAGVKAAAARIAGLLDFAYAAAVARRQPVTVNLDLERHTCWVSVLVTSLPWLEEQEGPVTRTLASIQLPEDLEISLERGSETPSASRAQQQWETIRFEPDGMAEDVLLADLPYPDDVPGIMNEILLGQDGPFGFSCGSRGIDDQPRILRVDFKSRGGG